jgi:LuxR family maltose regulon positive regulatory protein
LCNALTGREDSQELLEWLESNNLFLAPLGVNRLWYRYHPLFADFLRLRLRHSQPELWLELNRRAIVWYERNGLVAEAVQHALAVGDSPQAAELIEQVAETIWMRGEMLRLLGWLEALPAEMVQTRPRLGLLCAWILNVLGEYEAARNWIAEILAVQEKDRSQYSIEMENQADLGLVVRAMHAY